MHQSNIQQLKKENKLRIGNTRQNEYIIRYSSPFGH